MKTPVLIAAFNEESRIGVVLESLPRELVDPIVAVNGSSDATAEIARSFGATVHEFEEKGKLPALQQSLRRMGDQALHPILLLDADTRPIFPTAWHNRMVRALRPMDETPVVIGAPVRFERNSQDPKSSTASAAIRSLYRQIHGATIHPRTMDTAGGAYYGPNQGFKLANDELLEQVLALPHVWPKEDLMIAETITEHGGQYTQLMDPLAMTVSPESASFVNLIDYVRRSPEDIDADVTKAYRKEAPASSISYEQYKAGDI